MTYQPIAIVREPKGPGCEQRVYYVRWFSQVPGKQLLHKNCSSPTTDYDAALKLYQDVTAQGYQPVLVLDWASPTA